MTETNNNTSPQHSLSRLPVLHVCNDFIIIDKLPDLKINSDDSSDVTAATMLADMFPEKVDKALSYGFRFVHRLDYATSGCLCVALNKQAAMKASKSFQQRSVTKQYLALLRGHVTKPEIEIDIAIGEDSTTANSNHKMCISTSPFCTNPKKAVTSLKLLELGYYGKSEPISKVLLTLRTGRRHQLRVHCQSIGHSILGDFTYSDGTDTSPNRMMLHSYKLQIPNCSLDVCSSDPFILVDGWFF
ncbi:hypothetical protein HELRODRAFT_66182 [Helobdella robusta]|uniref:Pseudouridine synthase RsuA/RluA-like domain-containing protein n=1 Tax=Helobdella robusta TaxID=6412 RepID=T1FYI1_HELRO|nr:hypothetical protein HELRODRAFT_66182 [Helobdella robusta]ESO02682.1 hypothetical protein HELRODRAFT_66182 [Helobdella robusta]